MQSLGYKSVKFEHTRARKGYNTGGYNLCCSRGVLILHQQIYPHSLVSSHPALLPLGGSTAEAHGCLRRKPASAVKRGGNSNFLMRFETICLYQMERRIMASEDQPQEAWHTRDEFGLGCSNCQLRIPETAACDVKSPVLLTHFTKTAPKVLNSWFSSQPDWMLPVPWRVWAVDSVALYVNQHMGMMCPCSLGSRPGQKSQCTGARSFFWQGQTANRIVKWPGGSQQLLLRVKVKGRAAGTDRWRHPP